MTLVKWAMAGVVAACAFAVSSESEARMGPVDALTGAASSPIQRVSDDFRSFHQQPSFGRVHSVGHRYRGYRGRGHYGHYRTYRRYGHYGHYRRGYGYGGIVIGVPHVGFSYGTYHRGYVHRPRPVYRHRGSYEPWSQAWHAHCSRRYRTFNPRTGYYFYKPGRQRFCR